MLRQLPLPLLFFRLNFVLTFVVVVVFNYDVSQKKNVRYMQKVGKPVRNRTLTLIEREDDTRSWGNFLVYVSHSTTMPCPPRGWGYILIGC
jgi:hypothetical protein